MLNAYFSKNLIKLFILLFISLVLCLYLSTLGQQHFSWREFFYNSQSIERSLFFSVRLPRTLLAVLVGAALSLSGFAFQALLKNPMADPFILGVSGGSALGAAFAISLNLSFYLRNLIAFVCAVISMFLIYFLSQRKGKLQSSILLLVGVLFNSTTFSIILLLHSLATSQDIHQIWFMMLGSLEIFDYSKLYFLAAALFLASLLLFYDAKHLNLLAIGEDQAFILGVDVEKVKKRVFLSASLLVGACVSVAGLIGFVGLATPHISRLLFGSDHRLSLPASAFIGAILLSFSDFLARVLLSHQSLQTQIPVGVITSLLGAPFLFYLLRRGLSRD